eukprot:m.156422 g.156422  ORF g.156422 m.156422 type:complete len:416 (+) comp24688_c0_seq9:1288-2535(+)
MGEGLLRIDLNNKRLHYTCPEVYPNRKPHLHRLYLRRYVPRCCCVWLRGYDFLCFFFYLLLFVVVLGTSFFISAGTALFSQTSELFGDLFKTTTTLFALLNGDSILLAFQTVQQFTDTGYQALAQIYLYTFCIVFITTILNVFIFIIEAGFNAARYNEPDAITLPYQVRLREILQAATRRSDLYRARTQQQSASSLNGDVINPSTRNRDSNSDEATPLLSAGPTNVFQSSDTPIHRSAHNHLAPTNTPLPSLREEEQQTAVELQSVDPLEREYLDDKFNTLSCLMAAAHEPLVSQVGQLEQTISHHLQELRNEAAQAHVHIEAIPGVQRHVEDLQQKLKDEIAALRTLLNTQTTAMEQLALGQQQLKNDLQQQMDTLRSSVCAEVQQTVRAEHQQLLSNISQILTTQRGEKDGEE